MAVWHGFQNITATQISKHYYDTNFKTLLWHGFQNITVIQISKILQVNKLLKIVQTITNIVVLNVN